VLIILPFLLIYYYNLQKLKSGSIKYSSINKIKPLVGLSKAVYFRHIVVFIRLIALALLIFALARPRSGYQLTSVHTEGIDIVLALDLSTSMKAVDFKPNRLEASKVVAEDFIKGRQNDRIALVVFASESFTQCPLTLDYGVLVSFLKRLDFGLITDGTAIGMGLATSVNRLKNSKAKSKVIILLTDGRNNSGKIDPKTAADLAEIYNIRVYTIGVGSEGKAMYPYKDRFFGTRYVPMPVDLDESILRKIASITGGKYFRATDNSKLKEIYNEISEMEKTKVEVQNYMKYKELAHFFIFASIILIFLEILLSHTVFRKLP